MDKYSHYAFLQDRTSRCSFLGPLSTKWITDAISTLTDIQMNLIPEYPKFAKYFTLSYAVNNRRNTVEAVYAYTEHYPFTLRINLKYLPKRTLYVIEIYCLCQGLDKLATAMTGNNIALFCEDLIISSLQKLLCYQYKEVHTLVTLTSFHCQWCWRDLVLDKVVNDNETEKEYWIDCFN